MNNIEENSVGLVQPQHLRVVEAENPLKLASGKEFGPIDVEYETYGTLSESGDNAVLICHALSGNAHVAGVHSPEDRKSGWWDNMVGPGKSIDTKKYFVICSNFLGGCSGTTGPCSTNPETGKPYGLDFPIITIADMVRVQKLLLDKLGVKQLLAVVGGSIGGMQALQWAIEYPDFVRAVIPIATTTHLGAQAIAFDAVGRNAILSDEHFANGDYHNAKEKPARGLGIARMIGHITYLSEEGMHLKFGRKLRETKDYRYDFNSEFSVETYLDYQGQTFVERFDANSYLYITKACDYFDLAKDYGSLAKAFKDTQSRFLIVSFTSDWLFTPAQSKEMADALVGCGKDVSYCNIESGYGHDAFLLEPERLGRFICSFLKATHNPNCKPEDFDCCTIPKREDEPLNRVRVDYALIESLITKESRVLDVGCGDGELLDKLKKDKNIYGEGIEIDETFVCACIQKSLPILQYNIEDELRHYADKSFDFVILSQTMQALMHPEKVLKELLRVGKKVIVSFPNFAHWSCRLQLALGGHAPVTKGLPYRWYDSPNMHFLSLKDFEKFCEQLGAKIEKRIPLLKNKPNPVRFAPNLFADQAIYVTYD